MARGGKIRASGPLRLGVGAGGGGNPTAPGSGANPKAGGQTPVKVHLAALKKKAVAYNGHLLAVFIDCHAPGGHPTGKVAQFCAATANAYPTSAVPRTFALTAGASKAKPIFFAKGSVKVPVGGKKPLKRQKLSR